MQALFVLLGVAALAVGTPFLALDVVESVGDGGGDSLTVTDGWGRVETDGSNVAVFGHGPRFGLLLSVVAVCTLALAVRLLFAPRLRPAWILLGLVAASIGLGVAVYQPATWAYTWIADPVPGLLFKPGAGVWLLELFGLLCVASLFTILRPGRKQL